MMRRSTAYVALSTALATTVTSYAFVERPNFYSAAVYLSQSSACLIILSNAALVYFAGLMYGLQRLLFGNLRPIEIEQLWERGWIAGTEWLFALSIFRDDFGVAYMASFILLFVSKVWGWMVDGRLDILEQQNPANATKFHLRLLVATALNIILPLKMATYCFEEAMYGPKSGIMTMFTFEFGILLIGAISTTIRYSLWFYEYRLVQKQLQARTEEIRREAAEAGDPVPPIDDLDVHDLDLPGWEAKSSFQFALDIGTDFLKFAAYLAFFGVLTVLYGLPIYIVRDLYMTGRSFFNRVNDYRQYRSATHNMHNQYPDATAETLASDNTCIVCREDMKPWIGTLPVAEQAANRSTGNFAINERQRPKQLPCGHTLHFSCLRSWLERQQACPICRRSVLRSPQSTAATQPQVNQQNRGAGVREPQAVDRQPGGDNGNGQIRRPRPQGWGFRLGPFRFFFGRLDGEQALERIRQMAAGGRQRQVQGPPQPGAQEPRHGVVPAAFVAPPIRGTAPSANNNAPVGTDNNGASMSETNEEGAQFTRSLQAHSLHAHLTALEDLIQQDIRSLNLAEQRVQTIQWLLAELERARAEVTAHQTAIRLLPAQSRNPVNQEFSATTTAPQAVLDHQGNVLTVLPQGWNMVPLNQVPFSSQDRPVSASQGDHSTQMNGSASASSNTAAGSSLRDVSVSRQDQNHTENGVEEFTLTPGGSSGPATTYSMNAGADQVDLSPKPAHESLKVSSDSQSGQLHSSSSKGEHQNTTSSLPNTSTTTPDVPEKVQNGNRDARSNPTNGLSNNGSTSWSFDNVRPQDVVPQQTEASASSSTATLGGYSSSIKGSTDNRGRQPTIEDLQDEDLD